MPADFNTSRGALTSLHIALLVSLALAVIGVRHAAAQSRERVKAKQSAQEKGAARDREVAARYAPIFHQGLGDKARSDYITNFDFDGDWRGDNNWNNSQNQQIPLRAHVYYAVSETQTHFFIHYAIFHPQDYKGGQESGSLLSTIIREGSKHGKRYDPTGLIEEVVLAHENDMEGCLVVVAKAAGEETDLGRAQVVYVETLAHNRFLKYVAESARESAAARSFDIVRVDGTHPLIYIEPKGHGIAAYVGGEKQSPRNGLLIYSYNNQADNPEDKRQGPVSYNLQSLATTIWPRARTGLNETFGAAHKYGTITVSVLQPSGQVHKRQATLGTLGSAFLGKIGAPNVARPPWGWFDRNEQGQTLGGWFFDPAATVKRHFGLGKDFSEVYVHAPFLGVYRK